MTGIVKRFSAQKGYGFISQISGPGSEQLNGSDVFVHHTAIDAKGYRNLNAGDEVELSATKDQRGWKVVTCRVTRPAAGENTQCPSRPVHRHD